MAYQNVGTPRFYVNVIEWLHSNNALDVDWKIYYDTIPTTEHWVTKGAEPAQNLYSNPNEGNSFVAILGHTLDTNNQSFVINNQSGGGLGVDNIVNSDAGEDGFSIGTFNNSTHTATFDLTESSPTSVLVRSLIMGTYFDMPHSPDLSLTLTRDYSGIKTIETKGGASLSNAFYTKPPKWGSLGAWELGSYPESVTLGASGRRIWDLSFSYLDDGDVFGLNQHIGQSVWGQFNENDYDGDDINNVGHYDFNILTDDNFYSQVIHRLNGGQLPFIFQPNKDDNTNFAICKFDMKSFKFSQVAHKLYNVKLKIREVW